MDHCTKGYALIACVRHIEAAHAAHALDHVFAKLSPEVRALIPNLKPNDWYPRAQLIELLRLIATEHDESDRARSELVKVGTRMAYSVTNVFMRLVIRILTPALFAKKLPQVFKLDNRGEGYVEVDASRLADQRLTITFKRMLGYHYHSPVCEGWLRFFFQAMGKKDVQITVDPWSLETPASEQFSFELAWS